MLGQHLGDEAVLEGDAGGDAGEAGAELGDGGHPVAGRVPPGQERRAGGRAQGGADPVALLESQEVTRVPELVPLRHERMAASPFAFFRGAAAVFASDLAARPRTDLTVQLCGDAHLENFGGFATPERSLVFDINDFDETHPGPFEWDVKRLVASFEVASRSNGFDDAERHAAVDAVVDAYVRLDARARRDRVPRGLVLPGVRERDRQSVGRRPRGGP